MQKFFSLLSCRLLTAQYVSGVLPPNIKSSMTAVAASGFTFVSWWVRGVFVVGPARQQTQNIYHHDTRVKPEAATAVIELLMMDGKTPETCWAVNKRQDNKQENCCIWLVIYLNCNTLLGSIFCSVSGRIILAITLENRTWKTRNMSVPIEVSR